MKRNKINWTVPKGAELTELDKKVLYWQNKGHLVPRRSLIKTPEQIEGIRRSGVVNTGALDLVAQEIHAGMSTAEIDQLVHNYITSHGGIPATLGYEGYPKSVCTSINEVVCHGIPSEEEILEEGDIINVDITTILDGYYADASRMFIIGKTSPEKEKLVRVAKECLEIGMEAAKPFCFVGDIGNAIQKHAHKNGFSVVRDLCGHGVGLEFHEEPDVEHYGKKGNDIDYDLPKGSEIEFHVIISENEISYTALLVDFDKELNDVIELDRGLPSVSKLKELFDVERKRKTDLKKQSLYFEKNDSVEENFKRIEEEKIEERIDTLINSAENDRGSLDAADKKLKKFGEYLDLIEEILSEQEDIKNIIHSVEHWLKRIEPLVQKKGDFDQKIAFDDYKERFDDAKDEKDVEILKTILSSLWKLENEVDKVNKTVEKFFSFESQGDFDENKSEAEYYIEKGKEIIQDKDNLEYNIYELERINNQLLRLDGRFSNKEPDNMVYGVKRSKY